MALMKGHQGMGTLLSQEYYEKLFAMRQCPNVDTGKPFGIFREFSTQFLRVENEVIGHDESNPGVLTARYFNPKSNLSFKC